MPSPHRPEDDGSPASRLPRALRIAAVLLAVLLIVAAAGWGVFAPSEPETPPLPAARDAAAAAARTPDALPIFERPAFERQLRAASGLFRRGDAIGGESRLRLLARKFPGMEMLHQYLVRLALLRRDLDTAALDLLNAAQAGLRDPDAAENPAWAPLRDHPLFARALPILTGPAPEPQTPRPPAIPSPLVDGAAVVSSANSEWSGPEQTLRAYFALPTGSRGPELVMTGGSEAARRLNLLHAAGRAAGNRGDFYENRDDDHAPLDLDRFPQLTAVEHAPEAHKAGYARGLSEGLALTAAGQVAPPLIGNSSTALTEGPAWRSMPRLGLTDPGRPSELWREYASNQVYVYPEHKDHDPFFGDVFPANTPYAIVSQGSSHSDEVALRSLAMMLAAFPPETKARLIREHLVAPTLQMLWRRGQKGIETDADYLSPRAHPTVFDPEAAEPLRMIEMANAMTPETIPPLVRLQVLQESRPTPGIEEFGDGLSDVLFDTPSAIARLHRGTSATKRLTVAAGLGPNPAGRPVAFRWVLLRGDPAKVRIAPFGAASEGAEIEVDWQDETRSPDPQGLRSHRVDIAVFADDGKTLSAPAFVSVAFPPREARIYGPHGRLDMVEYDADSLQDEYSDPWLWPVRRWRDVYNHDADGRQAGWTRSSDAGFARFTRHGARVSEEDALGRPARAEVMTYPLLPSPDGGRRVTEAPSGRELIYEYEGREDMQGAASVAPLPAPPPAPAEERLQ